MYRRHLVVLIVAAILGATVLTGAGQAVASTTTTCPTGQPGFGYSFWNPYDNWTATQINQEIQSQRRVNDGGIVVDWSVDQEANAAWYPNSVGYSNFENTIPSLVSAAKASGQRLWLGLVVSPTLFQQEGNNWSFLEAEVPKFEAVANDLYRQYGSSIQGWYIPTEPNQTNVATYNLSYQYGAWLAQIDGYLHTHDGDKSVMIAPEMPSAIQAGLTPRQFIQEMQPMMAVAKMDVWNFEDGYGMTGWTPSQEAAGFALAQRYGAQYHGSVWADVYTPSTATPAQWEPYLQAIAATGTSQLSQWTFPEYMDPTNTSSNANASADYNAYYQYCVA
jgi:hypothetical protein